ncbi:substrate-binding domain-containing protein [Streptomyces sp. NPDC097619]|uniref:substrate-binding domain-containing protein n=1 Tax=Streptomyces sp. NPDC097619 TaxID=3157228 RepID=UPI003321468A
MGRHRLPGPRPAPAHGPGGPGATAPAGRGRALALAAAVLLVVSAVAVAAGDLLPGLREDCPGGTVRLRVAVSPDLAPAVRETADRARGQGIRTDGSCLDVTVTARAPHTVAAALGVPGRAPEFDVWIPDSELWVERARLLPGSVPVTESGRVASSPVVLAADRTAAGALGWPTRTHDWAGIAAATVAPDPLRAGAADPVHSATALLALGRITAAAAGLGPDGEVAAAAAAKALSRRTAGSDAEVLRTLAPADGTDPRRNQALILSEQAAFRHNTAAGNGPARLSLFYPRDGAPLLDYPYVLVDERRLDLDHSRAALRFQQLLGDPDGLRALARHGFRDRRGTAAAGTVDTAGGRAPQPVTALVAEPPTGPQVRRALALWTITVQSARLLTVVDASGSMAATDAAGRSRMELTSASLLQGLETFTAEDEVGLWTFATRLDGDRDHRELVPARPLGEQDARGTAQRQLLRTAFAGLAPVPDGATGLHDTVLAAYRAARDSYAPGKFNAVVVLTDGVNEDPGSPTRDRLVALLRELADPQRPLPLIALAIGPDADLAELGPIAAATGGAAYRVSDPAQIHTAILRAITASARD